MSHTEPGDFTLEVAIYTVAHEIVRTLKAKHAAAAPDRGWHITTCEAAVRARLNDQRVHAENYFLTYVGMRKLAVDAMNDVLDAEDTK